MAKWPQSPEREEPVKNDRLEKVEAWWSGKAEKRVEEKAPLVDWSQSRIIGLTINRRVTGTEGRNWIGWIHERFIPRTLDLGLSIGCGTGELERDVLGQGLCQAMEGIDIATGAIEIARRAAGDMPITYSQADMESDHLPLDRFDIAFCAFILHHIIRLDFCLEQIYTSLKADGLFAIGEYIGPCRFQWKPCQFQKARDVYGFLPEKYRFNYYRGCTVEQPQTADVAYMVVNDPSEAVRSNEILKVVDRYFERLDRRVIGGSLLNPLLAGILDNFNEEDPLDLSFLRLAALLEEILIEGDLLEPDFAFGVYRKRPLPLGGEEAKTADRARSDEISKQERVITELHSRFVHVDRENKEALERVRKTGQRLAQAREEIERRQCENAALKNGVLFRIARAVRAVMKGSAPAGAFPGTGQDISADVAPPVEERFPESQAPDGPVTGRQTGSPEVRAIMEYACRLVSGDGLPWLHWVRERVGARAKRALAIGFDHDFAAAVVSHEISEHVDTVGTCGPVRKEEHRGDYQLVFFRVPHGEEAGRFGDLSGVLGEAGALVIVRCAERLRPEDASGVFVERLSECLPPRCGFSEYAKGYGGGGPQTASGGQEEKWMPDGYRLQAARGFGSVVSSWIQDRAAKHLPGEDEMAVSLTSLLLYLEGCAFETGSLSPEMEVCLYGRGRGDEQVDSTKDVCVEGDIVRLQEMEMQRLETYIDEGIAHQLKLRAELDPRLRELEHDKWVLDSLCAEGELLGRKGPLKYAGLLHERLRRSRGT